MHPSVELSFLIYPYPSPSVPILETHTCTHAHTRPRPRPRLLVPVPYLYPYPYFYPYLYSYLHSYPYLSPYPYSYPYVYPCRQTSDFLVLSGQNCESKSETIRDNLSASREKCKLHHLAMYGQKHACIAYPPHAGADAQEATSGAAGAAELEVTSSTSCSHVD